MSKKKLLSTAEVAEILDVSDRRVRQLCEAGGFGTKVGGRDWIISCEELERLRKDRQHTAG